jgi:Fe2+ or Zn2+ uptake regulation protein
VLCSNQIKPRETAALGSVVSELENAGIKPSYQRVRIFEYMQMNRTHPTADQVFLDLKDAIPTLAKATVYNTLHALAEKGLIRELSTVQPSTRYDYAAEDHGHFTCRICNRIYDFPYDFDSRHSALSGFVVESQEIVQKGICQACLKKAQQNSAFP